MMNDFALELHDVRRASGLTQNDCAHLIGISVDQYGAIERGLRDPEIKEIMGLSILFGKSFEKLFGYLFDDVRANMAASLETLPPAHKEWKHREARKKTLARIQEHLDSLNPFAHAS